MKSTSTKEQKQCNKKILLVKRKIILYFMKKSAIQCNEKNLQVICKKTNLNFRSLIYEKTIKCNKNSTGDLPDPRTIAVVSCLGGFSWQPYQNQFSEAHDVRSVGILHLRNEPFLP